MSSRRRGSFLIKVFTTKHFHALGNNLSGVTSNTVLFPLSGLHLALNIDFRAFLEVISANFGQSFPGYNSVPVGMLLLYSVCILPLFSSSDRKSCHSSTFLGVTNFWVIA